MDMTGNETVCKTDRNGDIILKFSPNETADIRTGKLSEVEVISWLLESIDGTFIDESYCLSNYTMGATIYNYYLERCYVIDFSDVESILMKGYHLLLKARIPDNGEREMLEILRPNLG